MPFVKVRPGLKKEESNQLDHHHQRDTKVAGDQRKPINATWRSLKATRANETSSEISLNVGETSGTPEE